MPVEQRGQVTYVGIESTGNPEELHISAEAGRLPRGGTSRMNREVHVRICGRLGVKFPGPTRQLPGPTPLIVFDEGSLRRILGSYFNYYHRSRTHLSLEKDSPEPRPIQTPEIGPVAALPQVGGLHHRYQRQAA